MFEIVIFGSEPHPNYNRILLSSVLQGEASLDDITLNSKDWYDKHGITLYTGETVIQIDTDQQQVITDRKRTLSYDKLIVATGSSPHILPIPGADKKGVYGFRTIEDCQALMNIVALSKGCGNRSRLIRTGSCSRFTASRYGCQCHSPLRRHYAKTARSNSGAAAANRAGTKST
nr:FAD-dependent oxidoreductase [Bacillus subtilis]